MAFPQLPAATDTPVVSREADQFFCPTPPILGQVLRANATSGTTGTPILVLNHASTGWGPNVDGHLVEITTDADIVWSASASASGTIAAAGAFGTTSGATLRANERCQFVASNTYPNIFAVSVGGGTCHVEIRLASARSLSDHRAGA